MSWRSSGNTETDGTIDLEPGLYAFNQLRARLRKSRIKIVLQLDLVNHSSILWGFLAHIPPSFFC